MSYLARVFSCLRRYGHMDKCSRQREQIINEEELKMRYFNSYICNLGANKVRL
jgi:hypothetical protein